MSLALLLIFAKQNSKFPPFKNSMHFASLIFNLILGGDGEDLEALGFRRSSVWEKVMDTLNVGSRS